MKLDADSSGTLSLQEVLALPELKSNPLVKRVVDLFDRDGSGEVDFQEFVQGVSKFSVKADQISKLRFAFGIYDLDNDGFISNGELYTILKTMVGNNLKAEQLQQLVDRAFVSLGKTEDGLINFEEFSALVGNVKVHDKMIVNV